jgi:protocatechuate 3,4-dioxygenase alpha subunit
LSAALTPSQTVGPYLSIGLPWEDGPFAVPSGAAGAIRIAGRVLDGAGVPMPDALVETWQTEPALFGRCPTGADGSWWVMTAPPVAAAGQAPHLAANVFARGLLHRLYTRVYFADRPEANAADPVLARVPADRRATLIAQRSDDGYRFDIRIQGPGETVFFAV